MNDDLRERIRFIGRELSPRMFADTLELFAPHALRPNSSICTLERDLAYGRDARHRLDVFKPATDGAGRPIFLYVHGGGFVQGDKGGPDAAFYNNVGAWAAREGFVGVTMNYRLAPDHPWPAGAEDVAAAVNWLRDSAAEFGASSTKIFVCGQSSGGVHAADFVSMSELHGNGPPIAGAVVLSGLYDVATLKHAAPEHAYYGLDASRFAQQSSLPRLVNTRIPCLFTIAEFDPPSFQQQAFRLAEGWFMAKGVLPRMLYLPDANHMTGALGIGMKGDYLSSELAAFVRKESSLLDRATRKV